jgi:peroxiredoxin
MMVTKGDTAPAFTLPGVQGTAPRTYRVGVATDEPLALLVFAPSRTMDAERNYCPLRDITWFQFIEDLEVYVITRGEDLPAKTADYCRSVGVPLLTDVESRVAEAYGVDYGGSRREATDVTGGLFLVDDAGAVRERWGFPGTTSDLWRVRETILRALYCRGWGS